MIRDAIQHYMTQHKVTRFSPQAILFDMDGVLFDSMPFHARAWQETAERHQLIADPIDFFLFEGRTGASTVDELYMRTHARAATEEEKRLMYQEKAALFEQYNREQVMPGAQEVVSRVRQAGLKTVLVTGSGQQSLLAKLNHYFPNAFTADRMVTAYDVKLGKPHPEPYLMGLKKASVTATEAMVVENAPMGVQSAVAAGIFTIAVNTGPLSDEVLLEAGANLLFPSMEALAEAIEQMIAPAME